MPPIKWKHRPLEIKPYDLLNVATQSLTHRGNLDEFWEYVNKCRGCGILKMTDTEIRRMLDTSGDRIYADAEESKEYFSKSGNGGLGYELGGFSGCMVIHEPSDMLQEKKPQVSPDAERRATELLLTLKDYGWTFLGTDEAFHTRLCLDIKFGRNITLRIPGKSNVCLDFRDPAFGLIKKDDVVSLAFSTMFDNTFINHICKFDLTYKDRLQAFLRDYRKTKGANKNGQRGNHQDLPNNRGGYSGTHKIVCADRGTSIHSSRNATPNSD
jgi:hypothetical protein